MPILKLNSTDAIEVKRWQSFLLVIGYTNLEADGKFGLDTETATKQFQIKAGLTADGIVGAGTIRAAEAFGYLPALDNTRIDVCLPESGIGFVGYNRERNGADQYGTAFTVHAIIQLAAKWHIPQSGAPLQIGDISRKGGGAFPPHSSHRNGRDFDMRPFRKDKKRLPVTCHDANYDRATTEAFVRLVRSLYPNAIIYFNDRKLIEKGLTTRCAGHDNHLHLRLV